MTITLTTEQREYWHPETKFILVNELLANMAGYTALTLDELYRLPHTDQVFFVIEFTSNPSIYNYITFDAGICFRIEIFYDEAHIFRFHESVGFRATFRELLTAGNTPSQAFRIMAL